MQLNSVRSGILSGVGLAAAVAVLIWWSTLAPPQQPPDAGEAHYRGSDAYAPPRDNPAPVFATERAAPDEAGVDALLQRVSAIAENYWFPTDDAESEESWAQVQEQISLARDWCITKLEAAERIENAEATRVFDSARAGDPRAIARVASALEASDAPAYSQARLRRRQCAALLMPDRL